MSLPSGGWRHLSLDLGGQLHWMPIVQLHSYLCTFTTDCIAKARTPVKIQSCVEHIRFFLAQFLLNQSSAAPQVQLQLHSKALHINSRGVIMNFRAVIESSHAGLVSSWGKQWDSMVTLRSAWSLNLS